MRTESSCEGCYFLKKPDHIPPSCDRFDKPLYQIEKCDSGPMIPLPKTIQEIIELGNQIIYDRNRNT